MNKQKYNISFGEGQDSWKVFVNGIWFDDDEAMAKNFWGEAIHVEFLYPVSGKIIWVGLTSASEPDTPECFYVNDDTTVADIVRAMTSKFKKPEYNYDPVLDEGRGSVAAYVEDSVYNEFDGRVFIENPDFIDALDDIRPMSQFKKDHPKFKLDVYVDICDQVNELYCNSKDYSI